MRGCEDASFEKARARRAVVARDSFSVTASRADWQARQGCFAWHGLFRSCSHGQLWTSGWASGWISGWVPLRISGTSLGRSSHLPHRTSCTNYSASLASLAVLHVSPPGTVSAPPMLAAASTSIFHDPQVMQRTRLPSSCAPIGCHVQELHVWFLVSHISRITTIRASSLSAPAKTPLARRTMPSRRLPPSVWQCFSCLDGRLAVAAPRNNALDRAIVESRRNFTAKSHS